MTITVTQNFTASASGIVLDGREIGPVEGLALADLKSRNPPVWAAWQEFLANGTASGVVVVTAEAT